MDLDDNLKYDDKIDIDLYIESLIALYISHLVHLSVSHLILNYIIYKHNRKNTVCYISEVEKLIKKTKVSMVT